MKKIAICILSVLIMMMFCGCSTEEKPQIHTETQGDLRITYIYNDTLDAVVSKNVYNASTGLTTEYFYFYEEKGWGEQLVGSSAVTFDQEGKIIDKFKDNK